MKAVLIARGGFKKDIEMPERKPYYKVAIPPVLDYTIPYDSDEIVTIDEKIFYLDREFTDENDNQVLVYKER